MGGRGLARELCVLRRAFNFAVERRYLPPNSNPVPRTPRQKDLHNQLPAAQRRFKERYPSIKGQETAIALFAFEYNTLTGFVGANLTGG